MNKRTFTRLVPVLLAGMFVACGGKTDISDLPRENFTQKIPGTDVEFEMIYVPGGEFTMGSPESEPGRDQDEGPQRKVKVGAYWIASCEATWEQYDQYAFIDDPNVVDAVSLASPKLNPTFARNLYSWFKQQMELWRNEELDAITHPSPFYADYYHGMGRGSKPVIGASKLNARKFCDWLSKKTGRPYRLPTEAQWEYAARAGSSSMYYFGDDPARLGDYAWYEANSDYETRKVGLKKPNDWGLHDMLGNVWEFTYDYYDPEFYKNLSDGVKNPQGPGYGKGFKAGLRGGSWDDFAEDLRVANRLEQQDIWNERDPQRPRGPWWLIDGIMVGFRVVIPAQ